MQLALRSVAARGGSALIINTEGPYPAQRLLEMARGLPGGEELAARVKIADVADASALQAYVEQLPQAVVQHGIRLVIVDSVAGALRGDLAGGDAPERSQRLFTLAAALLRVSADAGCGVVAVNQVSDVVEGGAGGAGTASALAASALAGVRCVPRLLCAYSVAGSRWLRPALGLSWDAACTHRRLMVLAAVRSSSGGGGGSCGEAGGSDAAAAAAAAGTLRTIFLLSSPALPAAALHYRITAAGLVSVGGVSAV
jgi:RAD51-like protein 1